MAEVGFVIELREDPTTPAPSAQEQMRDALPPPLPTVDARQSLPAGQPLPIPLPVILAAPPPIPAQGEGGGHGGPSAKDLMGGEKQAGTEAAGGEKQAGTEAAGGEAGGAEAGAEAGGAEAVELAAGVETGGVAILIAESLKAVVKVVDFTRAGIEALGRSAAEAASNDYLPSFNRAVSAAAEQADKIPIVGAAVAASFKLVDQAVDTFAEVTNAFVARGKQLAAYSPDLALAGAKVEIRDMLADIKEADTLGPSLARLTDAQDQAWNELREILLPIKRWLIEVLATIMEKFVEWMRDITIWSAGAGVALEESTNAIVEAIQLNFKQAWETIKEMPDHIEAARKKSRDAEKVMDGIMFVDRQLAEMERAARGVGKVGDQPGRLGLDNGFNIPLVGGL